MISWVLHSLSLNSQERGQVISTLKNLIKVTTTKDASDRVENKLSFVCFKHPYSVHIHVLCKYIALKVFVHFKSHLCVNCIIVYIYTVYFKHKLIPH